MANEAASGFTFLYSLLSGDGTLAALVSGVFSDYAPAATAPDWVVLGHQSGVDTLTATAVRRLSRNLYRILAVGPESHYTNLVAIANRFDALLMPADNPLRNATSGGVTVLAAYREQPLALAETVPGSAFGPAWLNLGGLYRLEFAAS
jgi:hypothetical protein